MGELGNLLAQQHHMRKRMCARHGLHADCGEVEKVAGLFLDPLLGKLRPGRNDLPEAPRKLVEVVEQEPKSSDSSPGWPL